MPKRNIPVTKDIQRKRVILIKHENFRVVHSGIGESIMPKIFQPVYDAIIKSRRYTPILLCGKFRANVNKWQINHGVISKETNGYFSVINKFPGSCFFVPVLLVVPS